MEAQKGWKKILWAVNALAEDKELENKVAECLTSITKGSSIIEPVYVLGPDELRVQTDFFSGQIGEFRFAAEKALAEWFSKVSLPGVTKPTVLVSSNHYLRNAVGMLLNYAHESNADLIAVSTLSRKGATRFLFGSFAETLVLHSDIPVLIVSPKTKFVDQLSEVLFPTDLGETSKEALERVTEIAKALNVKLTLFHHVEYPMFTGSFASMPAYDKYFENDVASRTQRLEEWQKELSKQGIESKAVIDQKSSYSVDAILKYAEQMRNGLIAMASQSGALASTILGSTCRRVIREASSPVWVIHPQKVKKIEKAEASEQLARQRARF